MPDIAPTLQEALDDWATMAPKLPWWPGCWRRSCRRRFPEPAACAAPLPRAYQWADGSAYVNHVELVRKARGAEMPESFWTDPLMYQGGSDTFLGPRDPILMADEAWGIDLEGEVAVITDDVPMGVTPPDAARDIRLVMLVNDVSLAQPDPGGARQGLRLLPVEAGLGFLAGGGDPGRAGRRPGTAASSTLRCCCI